MSRILTLPCCILLLTLCCSTAQAGDLEAFKAAYARASEAHEEKAYSEALKEWETCATLLENFEENEKIAAIKELVLTRQGECHMHAAEADPADMGSIDATVAVFEGLLKRKKLYSLKKEELNAQLAVALSMKGNASAQVGNLAEARKVGKQAQALWAKIPANSPFEENRARTNSLLSKVFQQTADFREAEATLQQAIAWWEKTEQVEEGLRERNLLYALHLDMGKVLQAEEEFGKLYAELKAGERERTPLAVECLTNRGVAALYLGKYNEADEYLTKAVALAEETPGVAGTEAIANNIGILRYRQGLAYDALSWFARAGKGQNALVKARSLSNAGAVYGNLYFAETGNAEHFESSEKKLSESMELAQSIDDVRTCLSASGNLGRLHTTRARASSSGEGQEDCTKARDVMARAWQKLTSTQELLLETASLAQNLGDLYLLMAERYSSTPAHPSLCQKSDLRACAADFYAKAQDAASRMGNMEDLWYAHYGLARVLRAQKNLPKAVEEYRKAITIIESMRDLLSGSASIGFLHDKHMVYTELIDLLLESWAETKAPKEKQQAAIQALEVLEKSRLSALKSIFEQALPAERQRLGQELASLRFRERVLLLDPKGNAKELAALKKSVEDLEKQLEKDDTLLQRPELALAACQKRIKPDQAVLELYYNDTMIYIWKIDGAGVTLYATDRTYEDVEEKDFMAEYVENFTLNIVTVDKKRPEESVDNTRTNLQGIYEKLFVESGLELDPGCKRLTVISYRRLSVVPFAALITGDTFNEVLGNQYEIDTLVSLQQLLQEREIAEKSLYAIGNPDMPPGLKAGGGTRGDGELDPERERISAELLRGDPDGSFPQLADAGKEVQDIGAMFAARNLEVKSIADQPVEIGVVLEDFLSAPYSYIHFATHGKLLSSEPLLSFLTLSPSPEASDPALRTGYFTVKTIRERLFGKLKETKLCVLSCCQTALIGKMNGMEYASLAGAFQSTGAQTILATLWEVPSAETATLIQTFYERLFAEDNPGRSYAKALREAQEVVRKNKSDPFFWAAFIIIGPGN